MIVRTVALAVLLGLVAAQPTTTMTSKLALSAKFESEIVEPGTEVRLTLTLKNNGSEAIDGEEFDFMRTTKFAVTLLPGEPGRLTLYGKHMTQTTSEPLGSSTMMKPGAERTVTCRMNRYVDMTLSGTYLVVAQKVMSTGVVLEAAPITVIVGRPSPPATVPSTKPFTQTAP